MGDRRELAVSRSSILNAVLVGVLLGMLPSALYRLWQTGDPYLFTPHFFSDMLARVSGPGRLRFLLQPLAAILLGARDGARDARAGLPPFLWALFFHGKQRAGLWRHALASMHDAFVIAILLDLVAQAILFREIHPGAALLLGPLLISLPYAACRGVANRVARRRQEPAPLARAS